VQNNIFEITAYLPLFLIFYRQHVTVFVQFVSSVWSSNRAHTLQFIFLQRIREELAGMWNVQQHWVS